MKRLLFTPFKKKPLRFDVISIWLLSQCCFEFEIECLAPIYSVDLMIFPSFKQSREWRNTSIFVYLTRLEYFFEYLTQLDGRYWPFKILIFSSTIYIFQSQMIIIKPTRLDLVLWYSQWLIFDLLDTRSLPTYNNNNL